MHPRIPSELNFPAYLLNFPFTVDNRVPNNVLMEPLKHTKYNYELAFTQFMNLYKYLTSKGLVYLLPSEGDYQDQVYVANLGCYLPHTKNTVVISNYKSEPRIGEEKVGAPFFRSMGYEVIQPLYTFEGEADLKYLRNSLYIGGYGIRTDRRSYDYIMGKTSCYIIEVEMQDEKLYHFDCMFLPLTDYKVLLSTHAFKRRDLRQIESVAEIIDVPEKYLYGGWTNCVMYNNEVIGVRGSPESEKDFKDFISKHGFTPVTIDLSEFAKSGADLSCMVFHLNYKGRFKNETVN